MCLARSRYPPIRNHHSFDLRSCSLRSRTMCAQEFLPQRRSIRLKHYDYSRDAAYFVTICTHDNKNLFGKIVGRGVVLSEIGKIMESCWKEIPEHFPGAILVSHVVMPNHLHGLIVLRNQATRSEPIADRAAKNLCRARHAVPLQNLREFGDPDPNSIPTIVGAFKAACTKLARQELNWPHLILWQRGYFEHII